MGKGLSNTLRVIHAAYYSVSKRICFSSYAAFAAAASEAVARMPDWMRIP